MSNDGLRALFAEIGTVESVALVTDGTTGYSRGYGFVEMASAEAAAAAVKKLHRLEVDGRRLTVHLAATH
jgi:RNA recognition motif-containing protein